MNKDYEHEGLIVYSHNDMCLRVPRKNYFDFINVSRFSLLVGVNESKMRQYKSGLAYPGEKTTKKIISAIHKIGFELSNATI